MTEADRVDDAATPPSCGQRLRAAREAQGLSLSDIATRTRIPLRHLEAMEEGNYSGLPSPTYAVGFARAYARITGLDDVEIAREVRVEVDRTVRPVARYEPYATDDPARVPSRGVVIVTTGMALAIVILTLLWFGTSWFHQAPDANIAGAPAAPAVVTSVPVPASAPAPTAGQVVLTATDTVWLRVYDAANTTLFIGTMKPGDRFEVPAGADHPQINVGRPDKLQVTLNGSAMPPLGTGERPIKNVAVDAQSIATRIAGAPAATDATPGPTPSPTTLPIGNGSSERADPVRHTRALHPRSPDESATARANRTSAAAAQAGEVPSVSAP